MMINNMNLKKIDLCLTNDSNHRNLNLLTTSRMGTSENLDKSLQYAVSKNNAPILNKYNTLSNMLVADSSCSTNSTKNNINFKSALSTQIEKSHDDRLKEQQHQHVRLQNNGWNYHNFCRFYKNHTNNNNNNNNKISQEFNMQKKCIQVPAEREVPQNLTINDIERHQVLGLMKSSITQSNKAATPLKRTEDQENAFRLVEDVHNYAKLNQQAFSESTSTETSRSSTNVAEDEDDKLDNYDDNAIDDDNAIATPLRYLPPSKFMLEYKPLKKEQRKKTINKISNNYHDEEDVHIDVETVPKDEEMIVDRDKNEDHMFIDKADHTPPDHHARRPMNAFLIFCKRHRAIVKDRYKALENRAITKILGDWWASLDLNDKQCFTDLAQQNKDAFFSANPNFKWYKLPAPPLRTLQTRPTPNEPLMTEHHDNNADNYFKFADETQMGDLNALLMYDRINKKKMAANKVNGALQKALGETKNYLNMHMINSRNSSSSNLSKRVFSNIDTHSPSSNSSGEDFIPKKSSRSCKGKIYQELIQSGQITTAIVKKTKETLPKGTQDEKLNFTMMMNENNNYEHDGSSMTLTASTVSLATPTTTIANSINFNGNHTEMPNFMERSSIFDLEEKIKELPALNLDEYLLRKRNVKKKRKVNVNKKRNIKNVALKTNNINLDKDSNNSETKNNHTNSNIIRTIKRQERINPSSKTVVAVGSQKRKARKESITRRDVSIVENEITAVLPMNNTSNYFQESNPNDCLSAGRNSSLNLAGDDKSLILNNNTINTVAATMQSDVNDFNKMTAIAPTTTTISPTSDLLILAEVAVNRTQCSQE